MTQHITDKCGEERKRTKGIQTQRHCSQTRILCWLIPRIFAFVSGYWFWAIVEEKKIFFFWLIVFALHKIRTQKKWPRVKRQWWVWYVFFPPRFHCLANSNAWIGNVLKLLLYNELINCEFQLKLYHAVIEDVIAGVRDSFLDEGVDEQVLQEMKQLWTTKLMASKAVEANIEPAEVQPPPVVANNPPKSKVH